MSQYLLKFCSILDCKRACQNSNKSVTEQGCYMEVILTVATDGQTEKKVKTWCVDFFTYLKNKRRETSNSLNTEPLYENENINVLMPIP